MSYDPYRWVYGWAKKFYVFEAGYEKGYCTSEGNRMTLQQIKDATKLNDTQLLHEIWTNLRLLDSVNETNYAELIAKELGLDLWQS
jgi:hypothetical protein